MNGMEMMLVNILNGLGIDPKEIMEKASNLMANVESKLNSFDDRLARIEKALNIKSDLELSQEKTLETLAEDQRIAQAMAEKYDQ